MRSGSRERETSFRDTEVRKVERIYAIRTCQKENRKCDRLLSFCSLQIWFATQLASSSQDIDCRDEVTRWNVDGRATSIFFYVECAPREVSRLSLLFPFFSSLKIKSHYLSTAVLLYNVNNAPPHIFTGLRVHYGERRGHVRKEGLAILILCISARVSFSSRTAWGTSVD